MPIEISLRVGGCGLSHEYEEMTARVVGWSFESKPKGTGNMVRLKDPQA